MQLPLSGATLGYNYELLEPVPKEQVFIKTSTIELKKEKERKKERGGGHKTQCRQSLKVGIIAKNGRIAEQLSTKAQPEEYESLATLQTHNLGVLIAWPSLKMKTL